MKTKLSKDNIILLALLYNYLANYELELYEWRTQSFISIIKRKLESENSEIEITDEDTEEQTNETNKFIEISEDGKTYKLINLCNIESWYKTLPKELINISLKNVVLPTLYAEKLKLLVPIKKEYFEYQGTGKVYSNSENGTRNIVLMDLERENAKNIEIQSIKPSQSDNEQEYIVSYKCDKCYESLDLSVLEKRIAEKKAILSKLTEKRDTLLKISTNKNKKQKIADELQELDNEINKIDIELNGKKAQDNYSQKELPNDSKEMIDLASQCSSVFEIKSIEIPEDLSDKLRPLIEIPPKKIELPIKIVSQKKRRLKK